MAALGRTVDEGSVQTSVLSVDVFFDPYRDDPRFEAVMQALGLPDLGHR